jgi:DNA-3-methyladenine glycosylase
MRRLRRRRSARLPACSSLASATLVFAAAEQPFALLVTAIDFHTVILPRRFYNRPSLDVARDLIGKVLVHETRRGVASGVIVEVEAYIGESDPACHAAPGRTSRNAPLYGPPGVAYVYLNYGIHYLVNAVTEAEGWPAAVLIRALEPKDGIPLMRRRRATGSVKRPSEIALDDLCRGPGNLTKALGIDAKQNLFDLTGSALRIEDQKDPKRPVTWTRRIGINVGVEQEWRVIATDSASVSGRRRL